MLPWPTLQVRPQKVSVRSQHAAQDELKGATSPPAGEAVQAFWLGHASCLVQMEGVTFLTDPVFSQRCSPVQWMGPK